jgi:PTS system cellobiose-specific IIB component
MPRIVLCCAAGMSTSMLVNKMKAEAQQRALALEIYAVPVAEFERELPNADVILLGPQVKYEAARLTELAAPHGKAVAVIDMADYGMMRGAAVLDKALALLNPNLSHQRVHFATPLRPCAGICTPKMRPLCKH